LQLDDLARADLPVNIPGTSVEYPNWRRKLPVTLAELFADAAALRLLQTLGEERPK
jgi:4-alpha-glucanotransferase